jgi:hypothetical protein
MSNPVHYERRFTPERRTRPRRRDGSSPAAPTPSPAPDRQPGPTALLTDRLWTVREAAAFLGRSTSWVITRLQSAASCLARAEWAGASASSLPSCTSTRAVRCRTRVRWYVSTKEASN